MKIGDELKTLLKDATTELGVELSGNLVEAALYADQRAAYLATIVGQVGFDLALRAERDSVALKLGLETVASADAADYRLVGIIQGVLAIGAKALTGGLA